MQFDRAMSLLLAGYPVTRAAWNGRKEADGETIHRAIVPSEHGFHFEGRRTIYGREQDFSNTLALTSADLAADDWSATPPDSDAVRAIIDERHRQMSVEGWSLKHDDTHVNGELAAAATCYAYTAARGTIDINNRVWPWDLAWWKPDGRRRNLIKAGALILAEIERLDRATLSNQGSSSNGQ